LPSSSTREVVQKGGEVIASVSASGAAASATLASLLAGHEGRADELVESNMGAYESPSFTIPTMDPRTTEQHIGSGDIHAEL